GVDSATIGKYRLTASAPEVPMEIPGYLASPGEETTAALNFVGPSFFRTMAIPILAGRDFTAGDSENAPGVGVINESLSRRYFGAAIPLGRRLSVYASRWPQVEIVGVVADVRPVDVRGAVQPALFLSYLQASESLGNARAAAMMIHARVAGDPA